jgi:HAD superfamily hydrolase (TIGR01548 family)
MRPARFDALLLDMDGVLLDTRPSFTAAVFMTAQRCAVPPGLEGGWGEPELEALRLAGGFNNDWDAAAAVALLGPQTGTGRAWRDLCGLLARDGGGPGSVARRCGERAWAEARGAVEPLFQRLYAGPKSSEVYGLEPTEERGLYELEVPLASAREILAPGLPIGIFTGRTREEAALGLARLGLDLPRASVVCDEGPSLRKPRPEGLLALASALGARRPLYVGDTVDDMGCVRNAVADGLEARFAGVAAEDSDRERRFAEGGAVVVAPSLVRILGELFPCAVARASSVGG